MIELYLDTADVKKVTRFHECLPLKGITTNPSILAQSGQGLNQLLSELTTEMGDSTRCHVQVVSRTVEKILDEARALHALPYDLVIKVPATETGLVAIKMLKKENIPVLATAIYSVQQGFIAALCGADYLAPYVNRIDSMGDDGIRVVEELQWLIDKNRLDSVILAASFKSVRQALETMKLGIGAITLPLDIAEQLIHHPGVEPALDQFTLDWQAVYGNKLPHQS